MTKAEALSTAASWWVGMIFTGHWDNGDALTENMHAWAKSLNSEVKPEDVEKIHAGFVKLLDGRKELYCDYGCPPIDDMFQELKLPYTSNIHCPQKAGTVIRQAGDNWTVEAKSGYSKPYERL